MRSGALQKMENYVGHLILILPAIWMRWIRQLLLPTLVTCALLSALPVKAQEIVLSQIGPFTAFASGDPLEVNQGIKAYLAQVGREASMQGNTLTFFELDDRYSADGFAEQFDKASQKKPLALLSPFGTVALKRMLDDKLLDKHDVVVMNTIPGAELLRNPGHAKLFHLRAGDRQQIEKIVNNAHSMGISRLLVLYQDILMGSSGWNTAMQAAKVNGGVEVQGIASSTENTALATASGQAAKLGVQGVLVLGTPGFMAAGVAALRRAGIAQPLFVLSYVSADQIVKAAGLAAARGVGITQTFPDPNGHTLPLQREFQLAMKAAFPQISTYTSFHLEGYLCARTVIEAIKRRKDKELNGTTLARSLKAMGELDFGGFHVDFTKSNVGSHFVNIAVIGGDGRLLY